MPLSREERVSNCQLPKLPSCYPTHHLKTATGQEEVKSRRSKRVEPCGIQGALSTGKSPECGCPWGGALSYGAPVCPTDRQHSHRRGLCK